MEQSGQFDPQALLVEFQGNLCLSGGAIGADLQWGMTAGKAGHSVIHWSYEKHNTTAPEVELVRLTQDQLNIADPALHRANETLGRTVPTWKPWLCNLLRRNYYQVKWAEAVYAVGNFDKDGKVDGGTAWAVQMYLDRFAKDGEDSGKCRLYFYDQEKACWLVYSDFGWLAIETPPKPEGIWAGIGTRKLNENGKNAIRRLMDYSPAQ